MQPLGGPCRVETAWAEVNSGLVYTDRTQGRCNCTLLQYYASRHASSAGNAEWRSSILEGAVSVNGVVVRDPEASIPLAAVLVYRRTGWREPPAPAFLDVLWWDADLVAVHKPSGLQVLPAGPFNERCALTLLRQFHEQHSSHLRGIPAPVHRLGRGTSGVLMCACSEEARRRLSRNFAEHDSSNSGCLRKVYRALVAGLVDADEEEVDVPIGKIEYPKVLGGLFAARPDGGAGAKPSRSRYTVLNRDASAGSTLVDVEIFTGRPHQIRIHMAAAGHPLVGDPLYASGGLPWPPGRMGTAAAQGQRACCSAGGTQEVEAACNGAKCVGRGTGGGDSSGTDELRTVMPGDCGYHLHSMVLEFSHPITGKRVIATCEPLPPLGMPVPACR